METNLEPTHRGAAQDRLHRYWTVGLLCGLGLLANPTFGQSNRGDADNPYVGSLKPGGGSAEATSPSSSTAPSSPRVSSPAPEPKAATPAVKPVRQAEPPPAAQPPQPAPEPAAAPKPVVQPVSASTTASTPKPESVAPAEPAPPKPVSQPRQPAPIQQVTPQPERTVPSAAAVKSGPSSVPVAAAPTPAPSKPASLEPTPTASRPAAAATAEVTSAAASPVAPVPSEPVAVAAPVSTPQTPRLVVEQEAEQVFQHAAGKKLYSFRAMNTEMKEALAMFARANNLNIVPDPDVTGNVTLDVRDLPLEQIMRALLEANDFLWDEEDGLIRVRSFKTESFKVDYLRLSRNGQGQNSASLSAASSGSGRGGSGGGGGGGGGGGASGGGGRGSQGGSSINLTAQNEIDFWKELQTEIAKLLTDKGKETLAINMTAGLIQVTDRPSALKRVAKYLDDSMAGVRRQVDLEAKLYDVLLNDEYQLGVDWDMVAQAGTGAVIGGGSTIVGAPIGGLTPSAPTLNLTFQNNDTTVVLQALQQQGQVTVISKPRIRTLNNQTALIKVGTETPFFSQRSTIVPGVNSAGSTVLQDDQVTTITVGTILSITPQISDDDWISLDISPVLTSLVGVELSPSETTTAPVLDIKQASTLVRVKDGSTIVMGGLIQDSKSRTVRKVPIVGDIPILGKVFQGRYDATQKKELVIFVTPRIVKDAL